MLLLFLQRRGVPDLMTTFKIHIFASNEAAKIPNNLPRNSMSYLFFI